MNIKQLFFSLIGLVMSSIVIAPVFAVDYNHCPLGTKCPIGMGKGAMIEFTFPGGDYQKTYSCTLEMAGGYDLSLNISTGLGFNSGGKVVPIKLESVPDHPEKLKQTTDISGDFITDKGAIYADPAGGDGYGYATCTPK